ncbi:monothiol glutaredoxin-S9-like [Typha angustifolia]|uniref:monothiol glutaredoxin-S9-like n=1 Tax=Typha angustifolia TaxID=59011 RepID=UPI003C2E5F61
MQQAIPYSTGRATWLGQAEAHERRVAEGSLRRVVAENPVVVVGSAGCCMSHVVKRLLQGLGVNPTVFEVNDSAQLAEEFVAGADKAGEFTMPAIFIGGKLMGGLDRLMAVHISGELVPILKQAGALWL